MVRQGGEGVLYVAVICGIHPSPALSEETAGLPWPKIKMNAFDFDICLAVRTEKGWSLWVKFCVATGNIQYLVKNYCITLETCER